MTKIIFFGDNDTTGDAVKVLDAIKKEQNVDQYVFLGDGPYAKEGTKWVGMMKPYFPDISKLMFAQGNHEDEESESEKTQTDIEAWLPFLKDTPEKGTDQSWENTSWLQSKQVGDVFVMCMNSQDMDIEFKGRNQYNWVVKQLGKAMALRKDGKINWIINATHKPWFTLKSSHSPYTAVREIYSDIFKNVVDMNWHGHNHNDQAWYPMIATKTDGNAAGQPLFTLAADKKTLDFSKEHGWTTNIQGHSGHEHNAFKENFTANKNVMWANDKTFSYGIIETDPANKKATVRWKDISGKVLFEYNITRGEGAVATPPPTTPPTTPPPPTTDPNAPTSPPPGPGYRWEPKSKKWIPKLEDPSFLPDDDEPEVPPKPPQQPTPPPPPGQPLDPFGMQILAGKPTGKKVVMEKGTNHRNGQRFNVNHEFHNYVMQGYYKLGKGQQAINHKGDGPNHGGCTNKEICLWYEFHVELSDGKGTLQYENPHHKNHDIPLDKLEMSESVGPLKAGQWIGWATAYFWGADGFRHMKSFIDPDPFDATTGKPKNNWKQVCYAIEKGQLVAGLKIPRDMNAVIKHEAGLESEIRMHGATSGDTEMKNAFVFELEPQK